MNVAAMQTQPLAFRKPDLSNVTAGTSDSTQQELHYKVRRGETFESIAGRVGTDVATLRQLNWEVDADTEQPMPGSRLRLPVTFHTARRGDTYYDIAQKTGLNYLALMALNGARKDGRLLAGQEIQVPAVVLTAEQARIRDELKAVVADGQKAFEQMYWGEGSSMTWNNGNYFGYGGPAESGVGYEYSDDFDAVKVWEGTEEDEVGAKPQDPVADTKRIVTRDAIRDVLWLYQYQENRKTDGDDAEGPVMKPTRLADGRYEYKIKDAAGAQRFVTYDPKSETVMMVQPGGAIFSAATNSSAAAVKALGEHLGVKMPAFPSDEPIAG